jgi:hypothetical protein
VAGHGPVVSTGQDNAPSVVSLPLVGRDQGWGSSQPPEGGLCPHPASLGAERQAALPSPQGGRERTAPHIKGEGPHCSIRGRLLLSWEKVPNGRMRGCLPRTPASRSPPPSPGRVRVGAAHASRRCPRHRTHPQHHRPLQPPPHPSPQGGGCLPVNGLVRATSSIGTSPLCGGGWEGGAALHYTLFGLTNLCRSAATSAWQKHPSTWSLTIPMACMNA